MLDDIRLAEGLLGLDGFLVLGVYEKPAELGAVVETGPPRRRSVGVAGVAPRPRTGYPFS